eukprot:CAMPEP_0174946378 /NCGR_PEP_ID=MMETSP1355-20121228/83967_1 /TAXON_ID=464990 /ORGANISM="Hemiselmis tepida, Strain CCMP443" /LENGTH=45 /DNA_ID= /DNA_START= /DNA_END= /DNA_ORIENTATION=
MPWNLVQISDEVLYATQTGGVEMCTEPAHWHEKRREATCDPLGSG